MQLDREPTERSDSVAADGSTTLLLCGCVPEHISWSVAFQQNSDKVQFWWCFDATARNGPRIGQGAAGSSKEIVERGEESFHLLRAKRVGVNLQNRYRPRGLVFHDETTDRRFQKVMHQCLRIT